MTEGWPFEIEGTGIVYRFTDPTDQLLDEFDAGSEPWSTNVTAYFVGRKWVARDRTCYQFSADGLVIGYAAVAVAPCSHPDDSASASADYLIIFMMGVDAQFRGAINPVSGATYYESIMAELAVIAVKEPGCAGLYLRVDQLNERAIRAYRRSGFITDASPAGVKTAKGRTFLTMRKVRP
jgi:ribosomal protein S18 acetylase RimI-like enzyme